MDLNFGIRIGAKDDTQGVLRGALSGFNRFARVVSKPIIIPLKVGRASLSLLRDINLGLRPIVAGIDNLIERGAGLEVVRKSFESLTGAGGKSAEKLARRLVDASSGTLRLSQAMQIANRAMASGMNLDSIGTSIAFISRKAITTGKDAGAAIDTVITGLSRGSTLFLDDFGILVDGLEGVKRTYDSINGSGAWDALGPAAQKAETVRQAIAEMKVQTNKLGISGKETVFVWASIKNAIGDASDKLFGAIGRSETLRNVLTGVRDAVGGMIRHFEGGGSLGDLIFGKKGSESGGLFGFLKAGLLDLGEALGRGILGGLLLGLSKIPDLFSWGWEKIKEGWAWAMEQLPIAMLKGFEWLKTEFLPALKTTLEPLLAMRESAIEKLAAWFLSKLVNDDGSPNVAGQIVADPGGAWDALKYGVGFSLQAFKRGLETAYAKIRGNEPPPKLTRDEYERMSSAARGPYNPYAPGANAAMQGVVASALALSTNPVTIKFAPEAENTLFTMMANAGRSLLGNGVFGGKSRIPEWYGKFQKEFPKPKPSRLTPAQVKDSIETGDLPLSPRGRTQRRNQINLIDREIRKEEAHARREARIISAQIAREKRKAGHIVTPKDQKKWEEEAYKKLVEDRTRRLRERRAELEGEVAPYDEAKRKRVYSLNKHGGANVFTQNMIAAAIMAVLKPGDMKAAIAENTTILKTIGEAVAGFGRAAGLAETKLSSG